MKPKFFLVAITGAREFVVVGSQAVLCWAVSSSARRIAGFD